jgi:TnpA family transposase
MTAGGIDRTHWEMATYSALSNALASGGIWVPTARPSRAQCAAARPAPYRSPLSRSAIRTWLDESGKADSALREVARDLDKRDPPLFAGERLRFPKDPKEDPGQDEGRQLALTCYGMVPATRITDVLSQVQRWTGFIQHFGHVSTGLPPADERAFLATLIAEATNLGLSRMAEVCGVASRRALLRMQTWHMREETFRAALASLTDAIHAEPLAAWFGSGHRASADGQAYYRRCRRSRRNGQRTLRSRPVVKIYTTITDRYAPLHQTVIAGTAGEAIHALDGILGHESSADITALHTDGGGVSDIVFAVMHLLGLDFEPRIPRLSDRQLYGFEPARRYGRLAPLFGRRLGRDLIVSHWAEIAEVIAAMRDRTVTPSLILKKLSAYRQQNSLAAALREVGRIERTVHAALVRRHRSAPDGHRRTQQGRGTQQPGPRCRLPSAPGGFATVAWRTSRPARQRSTSSRPPSFFSTAAISVVPSMNCGTAAPVDPAMLSRLSPLGWDRINLTGDYIWSESLDLDADGLMPLLIKPLP